MGLPVGAGGGIASGVPKGAVRITVDSAPTDPRLGFAALFIKLNVDIEKR
jgi:hypothetical protein